MINESELIEFLDGEYSQEESADEVKRAVKDELKAYAKENNINPKAIMAAFALYKKYKSGKQTDEEISDISVLTGIIDSHFAN